MQKVTVVAFCTYPYRSALDSNTFAPAILTCLASVPEGNVIAYSQLASLAGYPGYHRQVAQLLQQLPAHSLIPWHRVVRANGKLAFASHSASYNRQKTLLQNEGVTFHHDTIARCFYYTP